MTEPKSTKQGATGWWVLTGVLALGCAGAGIWAAPHLGEMHTLRQTSVAPSISAEPVPVAVAGEGEPVDAAALGTDLDAVLDALGQGSASALVVDAATGQELYSRDADAARIPASNMKMLVHYALVTAAPDARFGTSVVQDGSTLTLVAGGDTLLVPGESNPNRVMGRAGIETLAQRTIDALTATGASGEHVLNLDTGIFTGPALNEDWAQEDIDSGFISDITPLAFYSHYSPTDDGNTASADRPQDAPGQVHRALLDALNRLGEDAGLSFSAGERQPAAEGATEVASVQSATATEQASYMMQESDNSLAEVLGRNLSVLRGGDGSTEDAVEQIRAVLGEQGLSTDYEQQDINGLSMKNRVPNTLLAQIALRGVDGTVTERRTLQGLPVAGYNGTLGLASRFDDDSELAGRGAVRAKTGTLNTVLSLTGYTVTESGRTLIFSVTLNDLDDITVAKDVVDRFAAQLTDR